MPAQLVAIDGPLKGQVFSVSQAHLGIGRGMSNGLAITGDPFVSREHCSVSQADGEFVLEDLDSQNGTFVNGLPVRRRILQHGDQVQAGGSVFFFLTPAEESPALTLGDETPLYGTTLGGPAEQFLKSAPKRGIQHDMVGESQAMQRVYDLIAKVAPADTNVLILGESGTGKELAARAIHGNSPRSARPFVAINCAALTDSLLESELFGHERGAFTGAVAQKIGRIERAEGGTFFLDEIGELRPDLQAKLLRVLQERTFERVGGTRSIPLNIRVLAATNRDLQEAIERSGFRRDLFYRLNSVSLRMPALRDRREDIPLLASFFVTKMSERVNRRIAGVSRDARALLMSYDWPGNVRELENAIEHAAVLGSSERILAEDLPESILECDPPEATSIARYHEGMKEAKKQLILKAFEEAGGDFNGAAQRLGLQRTYLHRLVRNLNLRDATRSFQTPQPGRQTA